MSNSFFTWDDFVDNFGGQLVSSQDVYERMVNNGLIANSLLEFDFHFISDQRQKIESLKDFLSNSYCYHLEPFYRREDELWELSGMTNSFPVTEENLKYWVLDMYKRGYEFDCEFDGFGSPLDANNQEFPDFDKTKEDHYFDLACERYNSGDLSGAIINWSNVIEINDKDVDAYYSRAIVKNELHTWKMALKDYDKAVELAPDFISAILNRGSLKDENGDYQGAIEDYDCVINSKQSDQENLKKAFFNKGNTYLNMKNKTEACKNWNKSAKLGADYAVEIINKYCDSPK